MKKFKELKEGLSHKVPVYHADRKTLVGHVSSGATSIGAAKLAKKKSASFEMIDGKYAWVASDHLREAARSTPAPKKDDYETDEGIKKAFERNYAANKEALAKHGITKGFKESTWQNYRQEALLMEASLDKPTFSPEALAKKHGVSVASIEAQLQKGIKVEQEHTSDLKAAREIALDHLGEFPDYYTKLDKANLEEARLHHVLKGHPYHHKSDAELHYIMKDAHEAEKAIGTHDKKAMWKYADQQNDAATILGYRKRGGKQIPEPKRVYEGLTPRERLSGAERLKPIEPAPLDHAQDQKKALSHHDNTNDSLRKNSAQGGLDSSAHKTIHHGTASKQMRIHEEAPHPGFVMPFGDHTEHSYHGFKEAKAARDAMAKHLKSQGHTVKKSMLSNQLLHGMYGHVYKVRYKRNLDEAYNVAFNESGPGGYKVGDKVVAKIGPHKGTVHTVIHVHPTGHLNIKPDVHVRSNRYHQGAAKADPKDVDRAPVNEEASHGMKFRMAIAHAKRHGHRVTYGTASRKWHTIDAKDRDFSTSFSLDPGEAERQGEAHSLLTSTQGRRLEEVVKPSASYLKAKEKRTLHFANKGTMRVLNRKTVQEAFQAAKDKKAGKKDNLPTDGANEPQQETQAPVPQGQTVTQDGGQPKEQKKSNAPMPEKAGRGKKIDVKGPGVDDKFQAEPIVTPLTTMPDVASPKNGSQGVR